MGSCCCLDDSKSLSRSNMNPLPQSRDFLTTETEDPEKAADAPEKPRRVARKHGPVGRNKDNRDVELPDAVDANRAKTSSDKRLIASALQKLFIFNSLTEELQDLVTDAMKLYNLKAGQIVFEEGNPAVHFFVLATGKLEMSINGQVTSLINPGNGFGELALLHDTPRTATVRCKFDSSIWGLDRQTFKRFVESINSQQLEENQTFLESIKIFEVLDKKQKDNLLSVMKPSKFSSGARIVTQGESGDVCFIIKEGVVSCQRDGREIRRLGKGEFFGEQALLYGGVRTATVIAVGAVKCVSIGAEDLTNALGRNLQQVIYRNSLRICFDRNERLKKLSKDQLEKLMSTVRVLNYPQHAIVVAEGMRVDTAVWILLRGELCLAGSEETYLTTFGVIGDVEFSSAEKFDTSIIVKSESADVATITKDEFEECLGGSLSTATEHNEALDVLSSMKLLRALSKDQLKKLIKALVLRTYEHNDIIVRQNDQGDSFYIIESGVVQVLKDGVPIRTITKMDYFGERSVLFNEVRSATIVTVGKVTCWVLNKAEFNRLIDERIRRMLVKRIALQDDSITLKDLVAVKTLGRGMFGVVMLAVRPSTGQLYAIKCVSKGKVQQYHLKDNLLMERNTLRQLDHALIMKLIKTTKDDTHLFFIMEYVRGRDFFDTLREIEGILPSKDARFYLACLLIILEHLHDRDIIHRDVKPENIMIDEEGYPKLIDFGTAKIVKGRTYTIIGTPHYMAPEVITGKGYNVSADYWSLGVILYECMCGKVPFGEEEDNPFRIYEHVLKAKLTYPPWVKKPAIAGARPVIESLLNRNPPLRIGGSMENFKKHVWFNGLDWEALLDKQIRSPFVPRLEDNQAAVEAAIQKQIPLTTYLLKEDPVEAVPQSEGWEADF